jgi:hypothetical protein
MSAIAERINAMRHRRLTHAAQKAGVDLATAENVLAAVEPLLREQIAQDMTVLCARHGLECAGESCHHAFAALTARGIL